MGLVIWAIASAMSGIGLYVVGPLLLAPLLPDEYRRACAMWYWRQAGAVLGRGQIVKRDHGTHTIIATSYRAEWGDEGSLGGETEHWRDEGNHMGRLFGRPLGLISERYNVISHPRHCEIGREHIRLSEQDKTQLRVQDGEETLAESAEEMRVELPTLPRLCNAHNVAGVLGDSADPRRGESSYEMVKKSQAGFTTRNLVEAMTFILAYAAPFALMWFINQQGASISRSISVGVVLV